MATETAQKVWHTFRAKGANLRVVREPKMDVADQFGRWSRANRESALTYDFAPDGIYKAYEGQDVRPDGEDGADQDAIGFLRRSESFNQYMWEDGNEPGRQRPTEDEVMDRLVAAAADLDPDSVEGVLAMEREGHNRPFVVAACERTLERIVEKRHELEVEQAGEGLTAAVTDPQGGDND